MTNKEQQLEQLRQSHIDFEQLAEWYIEMESELQQTREKLCQQLEQSQARERVLMNALVSTRKRLGDFQEPWSSREQEVDEIAYEAIEKARSMN